MNKAIQETAPWKAPGSDGLPTGYLKMCGKPLMTVLARLYNTTLRLGHWPSPFRRAGVVILNLKNELRNNSASPAVGGP